MDKYILKLINKNKLIILEELKRVKETNVRKLSISLGIDYKNLTRYLKEFEDKNIIKIEKKGGKGNPSIIHLRI